MTRGSASSLPTCQRLVLIRNHRSQPGAPGSSCGIQKMRCGPVLDAWL